MDLKIACNPFLALPASPDSPEGPGVRLRTLLWQAGFSCIGWQRYLPLTSRSLPPAHTLAGCNLSRSTLTLFITDVCQTQIFPAVCYHLPSAAGGMQSAVCCAGLMAAVKSSSFACLSISLFPK